MKYILNKKNIVFIIYIVLSFLIINSFGSYVKDDPQFDWLSSEIAYSNYYLSFKLNEKLGLSYQQNQNSFLPEEITNNNLEDLYKTNNNIFEKSWILDDFNIKYTIKNTETEQLITNTIDISYLTSDNYHDNYLFFITFTYDKEGNISYESSHPGDQYTLDYNDFKMNYMSIYSDHSQLKDLKNTTITYAVSLFPSKDYESYNLIYPVSTYTHSIYNQLMPILFIFFIICFFIKYDKLWLLEPMKKTSIYINLLAAVILVLSFFSSLNHHLMQVHKIGYSKYECFISILFILYILHLLSRYLRYLFDKKWYFQNKLTLKVKEINETEIIDINKIIDTLKSIVSNQKLLMTSLILTIIIAILSVFLQISSPGGERFIVFVMIFCSIYYIGYKSLKKYSIQYQKLVSATKELSQGHFDTDINDKLTYFKELQEEFSHIQEGFEKAVNEEIKSERMKTELITNVSHDLKTPLTSMITYIDLLKKEDNSNEDKINYINVLERNALRLKRLIDDLFEVTKANTGNVELNLEDIDIISLIKQAQFECDDILNNNELTIKENFPQAKYILKLDSLKTFRIFENLFNNIGKYALSHTRVYIDIHENDEYIMIMIKNISAQELNFTGEEIVERFVRGDKSRNTSGSGLGLAIAKSFTEIQGGLFKIDIDGDLFKAIIQFKK